MTTEPGRPDMNTPSSDINETMLPTPTYNALADFIEYVAFDIPVVAHPVDETLTLLYSMANRSHCIGVQIHAPMRALAKADAIRAVGPSATPIDPNIIETTNRLARRMGAHFVPHLVDAEADGLADRLTTLANACQGILDGTSHQMPAPQRDIIADLRTILTALAEAQALRGLPDRAVMARIIAGDNFDHPLERDKALAKADAILAATPSPVEKAPNMTDAQIKHMVGRFLGWRLPEDFSPDCGIKFDADAAKKLNPRNGRYEPVGTNLFTATQADAMVRHMLSGMPESALDDGAEGCAEREVGRYIYKIISARMNATPASPESAELDYLATIVADVEEYGADELSEQDIAKSRANPPFSATPSNAGLQEQVERLTVSAAEERIAAMTGERRNVHDLIAACLNAEASFRMMGCKRPKNTKGFLPVGVQTLVHIQDLLAMMPAETALVKASMAFACEGCGRPAQHGDGECWTCDDCIEADDEALASSHPEGGSS